MPAKKQSDAKKHPQETLQNKIKELEKEIQKCRTEVNEKNDKYLRTLADYQNFQKRTEKETINREEELRKKYLLELLDFHELLKKAVEDQNPKEGLKLLLATFEKFFEKEGVNQIESKGKPFDHKYHHAVSVVESNDCTDGMILEEVKKGYLLGEKILRPSQVIVTKKKE